MSPEERTAVETAQDVVAVANALLLIKAGDRKRVAISMLVLMQVLVGDSTAARVAFASLLCEAAAEMLRGTPDELLPDTVDVRRLLH